MSCVVSGGRLVQNRILLGGSIDGSIGAAAGMAPPPTPVSGSGGMSPKPVGACNMIRATSFEKFEQLPAVPPRKCTLPVTAVLLWMTLKSERSQSAKKLPEYSWLPPAF